MKKTDVTCPICGKMNRDLYLEETDGWMECECCGNAVQVMDYAKVKQIPVYGNVKWQMLVPLGNHS